MLEHKIVLLVVLFPMVCSSQAHGISTWTQLTASNIKKQHLVLTIDVKDRGSLKEFEIAVKRRTGALSPVLDVQLGIYDGETRIASCPIHRFQRDGEVVCTFQVSSKYLEKSQFIFGEMGYIEKKDASGKVKEVIPMPSGDFYWLYLKDFASSKK